MPDTERVTGGHFSALLINLDSMSTHTRLACGTISVSEISETAHTQFPTSLPFTK